jgi:hypothetical protein
MLTTVCAICKLSSIRLPGELIETEGVPPKECPVRMERWSGEHVFYIP